jgi:WD40 repeat protein
MRKATPMGFDAFMSYSHARDGLLAPFLQREIERFATPWYRKRSCRIFRDEANLKANSALWNSIEESLETSRWFIYLASPEAAASTWVNQEVAWWLANRSRDRLVIALTSGDFRWPDVVSVLPPALREAGLPEPRWVDVRPLQGVSILDRRDPQATGAIADIAAAVLEVPKDDLVGAHLRYHRRAMRLLAGGVVGLALLLVIALVAGFVAYQQRNTAREQARIATARELAALAVANTGSRLDFAQLVAVQAYRLDPNPQTRSALLRTVSASPHLVRFQPTSARITSVAGSADGRVVAAGTADGRLLRWTVDDDALVWSQVSDQRVARVVIDSTGRRIAATDGKQAYVWNPEGAGEVRRTPMPIPAELIEQTGSQNQVLTISPSGKTVAAVSATEPTEPDLVILDGETGMETRRSRVGFPAGIGLPDDDTLIVDSGIGSWARWSVRDLRERESGGEQTTPGDLYYCCGYSADGRYFSWAKYGLVSVEPMAGAPRPRGATTTPALSVPLAQPNRFAVSSDGARAAVAGGGALYFGEVQGTTMDQLPGTGFVESMSFLGGSRLLVSASGSTLALWDLDRSSSLLEGEPVDAPDSPNAGAPPRLAISPDGKHLAATGVGTDPVVLQQLGNGSATTVPQPVNDAFPLWGADSGRLYLIGDDGDGHGAAVWADGTVGTRWDGSTTRPASQPGQVVAARLSADGLNAVVVDAHGDVQVRDTTSGHLVQSWAGEPEELAPPWSARQNVAAISEDATTVAAVLPGGKIRITDVASGAKHELSTSGGFAVLFAGARLFVSRTDNSVEIWDGNGRARSATLAGGAGYARAMTVVAPLNVLARLTEQGNVELVSLDDHQLLGSLPVPYPQGATGEPPWEATTMTASRDGQLVVATGAGAISRWWLTPDRWAEVACRTAGRDLTAAEWAAEIGTAPPADLQCRT